MGLAGVFEVTYAGCILILSLWYSGEAMRRTPDYSEEPRPRRALLSCAGLLVLTHGVLLALSVYQYHQGLTLPVTLEGLLVCFWVLMLVCGFLS
jgi:hypothetical protein